MQNLRNSKRRVLVVDDNPQIHADYRKILLGPSSAESINDDYLNFFEDEKGDIDNGSQPTVDPFSEAITIDFASQGEEGLEMVQRSLQEGAPYQLAFVDIRMPPGWDGFKTIEEIQKVDPAIQVVICSAYSDQSSLDFCKQVPRTDSLLILKKPFEATEVEQLVVALSAKWFLAQQAQLKRVELEQLVEERTEKLELAAFRDSVTQLSNRAGFNAELEKVFNRVEKRGTMAAIFLIDVDFFKQVNDNHGHPAGDELLIEVARRLKSCADDADTVARLGGDEFAIVHSEVASESEFRELLRRLEDIQKHPFLYEDREIDFSMSIGIATAPMDATGIEDLLKKADLALYRSKRAGRATASFYSPEMDSDLIRTQLILQGIKTALAEDHFVLNYQPILESDTGIIRSFEALIRWNSPQRGFVPPDEFIPIAEEAGVIVGIGDWVLRTACLEANQWPNEIGVSVNMSTIQLKEQYDIVSRVQEILDETGFDPRRLAIEITETAVLSQKDYAVQCLHKFREMGISVVLDDFGVGYSSLSYVQSFPFDRLKLDRSFVCTETASRKSRAIMKLVGSLGVNLDIVTTAEGVETAEELQLVRNEYFHLVQGYLTGRPEPLDKITKYFETKRVDFDEIFEAEEHQSKLAVIFPKIDMPSSDSPIIKPE